MFNKPVSLSWTNNAAALEQLERRALLSGTVFVDLAAGNLIMRGDEAGNAISIGPGSTENSIAIVGLDGTTVVGSEEVTAFTGDIHVRLGDGDDRLIVGAEHEEEEEEDVHEEEDRFGLPGSLNVDMGLGDDGVRIRFTQISGALNIATGQGHDTVDIGRGPTFGSYEDHEQSSPAVAATEHEDGHDGEGGPAADVVIGGSILIRTDGGDDAVKTAFTRTGGSLSIDTGTGADTVATGRGPIHGEHGPGGEDDEGGDGGHGDGRRPPDTRIEGDLNVKTGTGNDYAMLRNARVSGSLDYETGPGHDAAGAQGLRILGSATVETHGENDRIAIYDSSFEGFFGAFTGPGDDLIALIGSVLRGYAVIDTGAGHDTAIFSGVTAEDFLGVYTGPGNDVLSVTDESVIAELFADGGSGSNTLADDGSTSIGSATTRRFSPGTYDADADLDALADLFGPFLQSR